MPVALAFCACQPRRLAKPVFRSLVAPKTPWIQGPRAAPPRPPPRSSRIAELPFLPARLRLPPRLRNVHWRVSCASASDEAAVADEQDADSLRAAALHEFRELVGSTDERLPLLHCAVLIARHRYPELDESAVTATLDNLAAQVREQLGGNRYPLRILRTINEVLYEQHGFRGNADNYYDPDNSCINAVLSNRTGIPITLSLVYQEVARAVGVPLVGLNLPCHFMLRPALPDTEVIVDAFNGGDICYLPDAEALLSRLLGAPVQIDPRFLEPERGISDRLFLVRILTNLKQIYLLTHQLEPGLWILRYLRAVEPTSRDHLREEGACLYHLGRFTEASAALRLYLQLAPRSYDAPKVRAMLDAIDASADASARAAGKQGAGGAVSDTSSGAREV